MKSFARVICLLLSVALLTVPVSAAESSTYASYFFGSTDSFIEITGFTSFEVWYDVVGAGTMDEIGVSSIVVQRSSDKQSWTNVKTYLPEDYPQMIETDTCAAGNCVTSYGIPGYYYRALVTFYAKNSRGVGEVSDYSETIWMTNQP